MADDPTILIITGVSGTAPTAFGFSVVLPPRKIRFDPAHLHRRQQALGLLRAYSRTYNERFDGFIVRKFNGDKVKIASGEVRPL